MNKQPNAVVNRLLSLQRIRLALIVATSLPLAISTAPARAQNVAPQSADQSTTAAPADREDWQQAAMIQLPPLARTAVARVQPTLVTIESFGGSTTRQGEIGGIRKQGEGNTTGIIISPDGLILTSRFNFTDQPRIISVVTSAGEHYTAKLQSEDVTRNLCLLKIQEDVQLPLPTWIPQDEIQVGQYAISTGVGYGDRQPAISLGIISAKNRIFGRAIQTDANISPANYGGPLIDLEGRVFGICVPLSPAGTSATAGTEWYDSGIGFVIPLGGDPDWLADLKARKSTYPGSLGVTIVPNPAGGGLKIEKVVPKFPAAVAGLEVGDVLWQANGRSMESQTDLIQLIRRLSAEQSIKLIYSKADQPDKKQEIEIQLARHPDSLPKQLIPGLPPLEQLQ